MFIYFSQKQISRILFICFAKSAVFLLFFLFVFFRACSGKIVVILIKIKHNRKENS